MRVLDLIRGKYRFAAAGAVGVGLGAVIGLFLPIRAPAPPKPDRASWFLPSAQSLQRFRGEQFEQVRRAGFWGELQQAGRPGAGKATSWTLSAIVTRPMVQAAVGIPGKPQQVDWVRIGAKLPDGSILVAANRDTVWFEKDGCKRSRTLYEKPTAESEACIGAKPADGASTPAATGTAAAKPAPPPARKPL